MTPCPVAGVVIFIVVVIVVVDIVIFIVIVVVIVDAVVVFIVDIVVVSLNSRGVFCKRLVKILVLSFIPQRWRGTRPDGVGGARTMGIGLGTGEFREGEMEKRGKEKKVTV